MSNILFVIVSYNAKRYMQECIQSIRAKVQPGSYKIVVADNASTDGIAEWLSQQNDIMLIKNESNIGFGPGCNQAVATTAGTAYKDYDVFLLNNDTVMTSTAVPRMIEALYSSDDVGAVGCMSSYAGNRQEYPVVFNSTEEYIQYGESLRIPEADARLEKVRLNGFAMLIRRNLWDEIDGFDEDFAPGYYEDDALSIEILKRGYRLLLQRDSFIYHVGSASFVKTGTNKLSFEHHELFIQKYGFDILNYVYPCGAIMSQIPFARDAAFSVLYIGCGLGAELKAIRSFYPNACCYGIEPDTNLYNIVSKTEKVFTDISSAAQIIPEKTIDLLIIDSNHLPSLTDQEKAVTISLCSEKAVELNCLHYFDDYPFDEIMLVIWEKGLFSSPISQILSERGVMSIISPNFDLDKFIAATGIPANHILIIDKNNRSIVPYLAAYFNRLAPNIEKKQRAQVINLFIERYKNTDSSADSGLQIHFNNDCIVHINEIKELIKESNLLNGTDIPSDSNQLERLINNDWNACSYITASDKYGDYGLVGFYCYNRREHKILHLALSWLTKELKINQALDEYITNTSHIPHFSNNGKIRILIKGDSCLSAIENYLIGGCITTEYWNSNNKNLCIVGDELPTLLYSSRFHIIIYSLLQYDYESWEKDSDKCLGLLFDTLDKLSESTVGNPTIILLLGSEKYYDSTDMLSNNLAELSGELNPIILDYAASHARIRIINVSEFISGPEDFCNSINHFSVRVFSDIAERVCMYINEKVDEIIGGSLQ